MVVQFGLFHLESRLLNESLLLLLHLDASLIESLARILNLLDLLVVAESVCAPDSGD